MSTNGSSFPGSEEAVSMMDTLVSAQQRWMKNVMQSMQEGGVGPSTFTKLAEQWQEAMVGGMGAWEDESAPVMRATMERLAHSQSAMMQLFQLAIDSWQRISKQTAEGDNLSKAVEENAERMDEQVRRAISAWSTTAKDMQAMWEQFTDNLQNAGLPFDIMLRMPAMMQGLAEGERETPLRTMFDQMYKTYEAENILERLLDTPGLGLSREFNEKLQRGFKAFQEYQRAGARYQSIVANIWTQALQRFVYEVGEHLQEGTSIDGLRDLSTVWTSAADDVCITAFRSDDYVEAQSDLLRAAMRFRKRRRAILEEYQRALDQPTRSELDEVHELLYKLRKQNKQLTRELKDQKASPSEGPSEEEVAALKQQVHTLTDELNTLREEMQALRNGAKKDVEPDDLTTLKGVGAATAEKLHAAGFSTYEALAAAEPTDIREALDRPIGEDQIATWQNAARQKARG